MSLRSAGRHGDDGHGRGRGRWLGGTAVRVALLTLMPVTVTAASAGESQVPPSSGSTPVAVSASVDAAVSTDRPLDTREVIVPIPGAERMRIDNPLGNVTVRAWKRNDAVHIIAEKQSPSAEALARLRVHFTAWAGGEISVETRVEMGGRERALPLAASRVDLVVEVPAALEIEAKTFAGDLSASGLRSGARLETTGGRIGISDVHGRVITRQLRGGQTVVAVDGDVDLDGVEGQMRLEGLDGGRVEARVVDGDISAENIRSNQVRLSATTGAVLLVGLLRPHAHYDLRSYSGEVRLAVAATPQGLPVGFELHVRSPSPMTSAIPFRTLWQKGDRLRAIALPAGAQAAAADSPAGSLAGGGLASSQDRPVVELSSVLGRVVLTAVQAADHVRAGAPFP